MNHPELDARYWENRYLKGDTGWDMNQVSPPIKAYIDQLTDKQEKILIPGAGNAYEAEYLHRQGFPNCYVLDFSASAMNNFRTRVPDFPQDRCIQQNFFEVNPTFDLIIEQTFFCALKPELREKYARKMHELLSKNGKLVGLLFDAPMNEDEPPFGGNREEYYNYFQPYFHMDCIEPCYNSIPPRAGKELFLILRKKT